MWLIDTHSLKLKEFHQCPAKTYAILSHTWGTTAEEPTFEEFKDGRAREKVGFKKIQLCCEQAKSEGIQYAWVDTCCIDKRNSTELSEAINSMFNWYQQSKKCYAYLADVSYVDSLDPLTPENHLDAFRESRWFTRGWTLQELIAPDSMTFFAKEWTELGNKSHLAEALQSVTGIDVNVLALRKSFLDCSVAQRMSWAARRQTTRLEDSAYCLIGLFNVNLPMMYGEGSKAFLRLQQQIIEQTDDETIFAWVDVPEPSSGLLAPHPANFAESGNMQRGGGNHERPHYFNTNKGLSIECQLFPVEMNTYKVSLQCHWDHVDPNVAQIAIFVGRTVNESQYRRVLYKGKSLDRINKWEASKCQTHRIFIPSDSHGLQLAPSKGLPVLHIRSEFQTWHVDRVRDWVRSGRHGKMRTIDVRSGMPMIDALFADHPWSDYYGEFSNCVPYKTTRVQFREGDLEKGIILAIKKYPHTRSQFTHYLQIGFDSSFRPIGILRKQKFWLEASQRSITDRLRNGPKLKIAHSLWANPTSWTTALYSVRGRVIYGSLQKGSRAGLVGEKIWLTPKVPPIGSEESGHHFNELRLEPVQWKTCAYVKGKLRMLGDLDWELSIYLERNHEIGWWVGQDQVCFTCISEWCWDYMHVPFVLMILGGLGLAMFVAVPHIG